MALFTADNKDNLIEDIRHDKPSRVYLIFGERFLCQQAADKICQALIQGGGTIHAVDGT